MPDDNGVPLNAEIAKRVLDNVSANDPGRWAPAVQTMIIGLAARVDDMERKLAQVARGAFAIAKELRELRGDATTPPAPTAPTPPEPAPAPTPVPEGAVVGQRSPEQQALESQMDAAIAASGLPSAAPAPAAPAVRARPGRLESLPQDSETRQATLNAIMDDASTDSQ